MMTAWVVRAEFAHGTSLEIWSEGEHAALGTIQDLLPKVLGNEITKISLTHEDMPR